jgi:hypothetical protein
VFLVLELRLVDVALERMPVGLATTGPVPPTLVPPPSCPGRWFGLGLDVKVGFVGVDAGGVPTVVEGVGRVVGGGFGSVPADVGVVVGVGGAVTMNVSGR